MLLVQLNERVAIVARPFANALVEILAICAVTADIVEARGTGAHEGSTSVGAGRVGVAVVAYTFTGALVEVCAKGAISVRVGIPGGAIAARNDTSG